HGEGDQIRKNFRLPISDCQLKRRGDGRFKSGLGISQLAIGWCLMAASAVQAQGNSSLSESKSETVTRSATAEPATAENEELRSTNELVTKSTNPPEAPELGLMDGSVISVKEEWSFVVGNLGEKQGVKIGMPMRVMRDDRKIATVRVVDVRQKICGAVVQEMDSKKEKIMVGDRLQVDAQPDVSLR